VGVQEVRWKGVARNLWKIRIFLWKGNENHELGAGFFLHKRIVSAVKKIEFVSDRLSYIILVSYHCSERSCSNRT
jgi:hypothetical protein